MGYLINFKNLGLLITDTKNVNPEHEFKLDPELNSKLYIKN